MGVTGGVGILGGAFDPPHDGHVALAEEAMAHFALDRLLVRVVADPGHKHVDTPVQIRVRLAEIAFEAVTGADVSVDPFPRTVHSLEALALPDPLFLIGADELAAFHAWERPERVLELARLGVATRPGVDEAALERVIERLPRPDRVELFPITPVPVSSSDVRARVAEGLSLEGFVPPAVAAEIARFGLYRDL